MKERAEATLVLSTELGSVNRRALSEIYLGWAQAMMGDLEGGIARMRHHMSELRAIGSEIHERLLSRPDCHRSGPDGAVR